MKFYNKLNNRSNRMATLEVNGINTDGFIALKLQDGKEVNVPISKILEAATANDKKPVGGNIANHDLHRRWVMAQWFRQYNSPEGYAAAVRNIPLHKQWDMVESELKTLAKLEKSDEVYFKERTQFFNISNIAEMLFQYERELETTASAKKVHHCKTIPYVSFGSTDIFVEDLNRKIYKPFQNDILSFFNSNNYQTAHILFASIKRKWLNRYHIKRTTAMPLFLDRYKGAGAYYTLQNMVLFHNCSLTTYTSNMEPIQTYYGDAAYEHMRYLLFTDPAYVNDGWRWTGMLRQCIADNNFSFKAV